MFEGGKSNHCIIYKELLSLTAAFQFCYTCTFIFAVTSREYVVSKLLVLLLAV